MPANKAFAELALSKTKWNSRKKGKVIYLIPQQRHTVCPALAEDAV
jgi:hypothetical protein